MREAFLGDDPSSLNWSKVAFCRLLEKLPAAAYTCDTQGLITYFNQRAVEVWGREPKLNDPEDRFCGSFRLFSPEGEPIQHSQCWMALALEKRREYNGREIVIERSDGYRLTALAYANPLYDQAANFIGAVNVLVDISDRKRAEQLSAHLASIVESSDDAIVSKSLDGTILSWNQGAERIFGYSAGEVIGKNITILIPLDRLDEEPQILAEVRNGHRIDHYETVRQTKDGRRIYVSLTVSPIRDKSGRIIAISKIARDITERKRTQSEREELLAREQAARAEAERANRAKDEFLAVLSHELRTPLSVMMGWARLLRTGKADAATQDRALEALERNTKLQAQLISDLLDVSGIIAGKLHLEMVPVDLLVVLDSAVEVIKPAAENKNVELQLSIDPEVGPVVGDSGRLQQIVLNLLSNAVKFSEDGGFVQLKLQQAEAGAEIIVSDRGRGIKPEFLPFIFERFRQSDSSVTRTHGGLGLGLAIARHLVELHGGSIHAHSDGEGYGSSFTVRLPAQASKTPRDADVSRMGPQAPQPASNGASGLQGVRILVVDDDADARELMLELIQAQGATVHAAASAREAVELVQKLNPHILVSDIEMPREDGYSLIEQLRALESESAKIPAIALTAHGGKEHRARAMAAGYQAYVVKPFEPAEFIRLLSTIPQENQAASCIRHLPM